MKSVVWYPRGCATCGAYLGPAIISSVDMGQQCESCQATELFGAENLEFHVTLDEGELSFRGTRVLTEILGESCAATITVTYDDRAIVQFDNGNLRILLGLGYTRLKELFESALKSVG